jgi:hypothetical protein
MTTQATTATQATAKPAATAPRRMTLASVQRTATAKPHRIVLYGVEGIGKTTFAALAPRPIFIGTEDGAGALTLERFPRPERWSDVLDAVHELTTEAHPYQTVAIDSLDWAEPLIWAHCCERDKKASIEAYGFGKGYVEALAEVRILLSALETLQVRKGMNVVLIAHAHLKMQKQPSGDDFERFTLKLNEKAGGAVREWAETVLFANWETFTRTNANERTVGVSSGRRLIYTTKTAAYEAKNRYALPDELELSWESYAKSVERNRTAEGDIRALLKAEPEKLRQFEEWLPRPVHELVAMRARLEARSVAPGAASSNESNEGKKADK